MCVICYKPKGVKMPEKETLLAMFRANSHGCGFCTPTKYYKSLSFESFYKAIKKVSTNEPCIIHFRLATHGSIRRANCHPFYDRDTNTFFAHNGVLNILPDRDKTDSETAFRHIFVPYIQKYGLPSAELQDTVMQVRANTGSKFIFMQGDEVVMIGDFQPFEGCYVSNKRFLAYLGESSYFACKGKFANAMY